MPSETFVGLLATTAPPVPFERTTIQDTIP